MKATGIVRRIDGLGRVVIPKEIRRTLHIRKGGKVCTAKKRGLQYLFIPVLHRNQTDLYGRQRPPFLRTSDRSRRSF